MNERIKQLAKDAEVSCGGMRVVDIEKFAELIVKECADFVSETATIETLLGDRLKEHFGVEE